jgi:hypothetical protein
MQALDRILALTETVEHHVERGEWTEAGTLDAERCRLLADLFADPDSAADRAAYREILQQLLVRNAQTIQRVRERQRALVLESGEARAAGCALRAYRTNGVGADNLVYLHPTAVNDHEPTEQQ